MPLPFTLEDFLAIRPLVLLTCELQELLLVLHSSLYVGLHTTVAAFSLGPPRGHNNIVCTLSFKSSSVIFVPFGIRKIQTILTYIT